MTRTLHTLRDPRATRTGQVHYVHFLVEGDRAVVAIDDCVYTQIGFMSREQARKEWAAFVSNGFTAFDNYGDNDRVIRNIVARCDEINRSEDAREAHKAAMG